MSLQEISTVASAVLVAAGKGAVVVGLAAVVAWRMKGQTAAVRHAVWAAALGAHLVLLLAAFGPGIPVALPTVRVEGPVAPPSPNATTTPTESARPTPSSPSVGTPDPSRALRMTAEGRTSTNNRPTAIEMAAILWILGALAVLLRYAIGTWQVAAWARRAERVDDGAWLSLVTRTAKTMGIGRPLTLLRGGSLDVPVTWGVVYPVVLLPRESAEWDEERRRFVLVHEMAHVKRLDAVMQVVSQLAMAIFWFSPAVWYAAHRVRVEREHACDDQVLLQGTKPSFYADELLSMVQRMGSRGEAHAFAALAMARRSEFEGRMLAILDPRAARRPMTTRATLATIVAALMLVGPLGALRGATANEPLERDARSLSPAARELGMTAGLNTATLQPNDSAAKAIIGAVNTALATAGQKPIGIPSAGSKPYRCTAEDLATTGRHTSALTGDDDRTELIHKVKGLCVSAEIFGEFQLADDLSDVVRLTPGGSLTIDRLTPRESVGFTVRASASGALTREYRRDGRTVDASDANRWLPSLLRLLVVQGGIGVRERVEMLRRQGGIEAVLREIDEVTSDGIRRNYFIDLLGTKPDIPGPKLDVIVRQAAEQVSSDGDLRAILEAAARYEKRASIVDAAERIGSSGDRRAVLTRLILDASDPVLKAVMVAAKGISSDGDKAGLLAKASGFVGEHPAAIPEYLDAAASIRSDGDKAMVLKVAAREWSPTLGKLGYAMISVAKSIRSSGDRANVLVTLARQGYITDAETKQAAIDAAKGLGEGDYEMVMRALVK
jgi:beta-lactamase regulating signal transducer with metallopeptidase domain